jgi:hypothetical protein
MGTSIEPGPPSPRRDPWGPREREVRNHVFDDLNNWRLRRDRLDRDFYSRNHDLLIAIADQTFALDIEHVIGLAAISDSLERIAEALEAKP